MKTNKTNKIDLNTNNNGRVYSQQALTDIAIMIKDSSLKFRGELTHPVNDTLDIFIEPRDIDDNELQQRLLDSFSKSGSANSEFFEKHCKIIPIFSDDMEKNEDGEITNFSINEINIIPKSMKIQSQSDIITNSSSEVFIVDTSYAEKISDKTGMPYDVIDIDYLKDHFDFVSIICKLANIAVPDFDPYNDSYMDDVISFIDNNTDILNEYLKNDISLLCNDYSCTDVTLLQEIRENSKWNDFQ